MSNARRLTNAAGAADYLTLTERHVRDLVQRSKIPYIRLGRLLRFDLDDLDAWIEDNRSAVGDDS